MADKTIKDLVIWKVAETLGLDNAQVKEESNLFTDLGADSLDMVELVMELERWLKIEVPDESYAEIDTVQQLITMIDGVVKGKAK